MAVNRQKLKLLHLMKMLQDETDDERGLTMAEILERLGALGVSAERKSVYRDIEALRAFGMDIRTRRCAPVEYALASRDFTLSELALLVDAVQSSRFLTQRMSDKLVRSVKRLAPERQRALLTRRLHVEGRIKMQNESVLANVDQLQRAMAQRCRVSFLYFKYDAQKRRVRQRNGRRYEETPVQLVYADGYYYLVAYNEKHDGFPHYRVDRMEHIALLDEPASRNDRIATFDAGKLEQRAFGMYGGEPVSATLLVSGEAMGGVIDRFGEDVPVTSAGEEHAHVHVAVVESPAFFGWVAQFGSRVRIEKPAVLASAYRDYLKSILDAYE
ncbi:helix-turn-helix transcriptional regulator [Paraeggerthella sp.]|uniref:helix-turn-helix transcriptional regulator n=1 Tax=Paraeggerthella sp. TaxID=2897350 RepID=UPI003AB85946